MPTRRRPARTESPGAKSDPRTVLDDPGAPQLALFVGWIPAAVAAVIGGIAVAILTSTFDAFVVIALAGTVVGYVVCLFCMFGIGLALAKRNISARVADWVFGGIMLSGAAGAIVVAILGSIGLHLAGIAGVAAVGLVIAVVAYVVLTDTSGQPPLP